MGEIDECLYEGAVRAGSVNRRSTRVKVRMKVHHRASLVTEVIPDSKRQVGLVTYDHEGIEGRRQVRIRREGGVDR